MWHNDWDCHVDSGQEFSCPLLPERLNDSCQSEKGSRDHGNTPETERLKLERHLRQSWPLAESERSAEVQNGSRRLSSLGLAVGASRQSSLGLAGSQRSRHSVGRRQAAAEVQNSDGSGFGLLGFVAIGNLAEKLETHVLRFCHVYARRLDA
ncbi:Uncharacterized protein Fot_16521 [Forsythia ovata]|uniref:Uncharacterized protein n=1 Tax=Forsythia ovata TaxID=205694 RepID=A0ABD1WC97_9LAMI